MGEVQAMTVSARPAAPVFTIDYVNELTVEAITGEIEFASNEEFSGQSYGNGRQLAVIPGEDRWFRVYAQSSNFSGEAFHLVVPLRPEAVAYSINYVDEKTMEKVASTMEFAENADFTSNLKTGEDDWVSIQPGVDLWFRVKASNVAPNFSGEKYGLTVPNRPQEPMSPAVDDEHNTFGWSNQVMPIANYKYSINGGITWTICQNNPFDVGDVNIPAGDVQVYVFASNEMGEERFESSILSSDLPFTMKVVTGLDELSEPGINIYPNPSHGQITINYPEQGKRVELWILNTRGEIVYQSKGVDVTNNHEQVINLSEIPKGVYMLHLAIDGQIYNQKLLIE
jgi:hypothetical protein